MSKGRKNRTRPSKTKDRLRHPVYCETAVAVELPALGLQGIFLHNLGSKQANLPIFVAIGNFTIFTKDDLALQKPIKRVLTRKEEAAHEEDFVLAWRVARAAAARRGRLRRVEQSNLADAERLQRHTKPFLRVEQHNVHPDVNIYRVRCKTLGLADSTLGFTDSHIIAALWHDTFLLKARNANRLREVNFKAADIQGVHNKFRDALTRVYGTPAAFWDRLDSLAGHMQGIV